MERALRLQKAIRLCQNSEFPIERIDVGEAFWKELHDELRTPEMADAYQISKFRGIPIALNLRVAKDDFELV